MPSSKRPRSACDSCVLRKCKCDALFPQCSACSKSNRKCFYSFFSQALLGSPVSETQSDSLSINIKATLKTDKANRFGETQFVENPQFMNEIMERVMTLDSPLCPRSPIPYNAIIDKWRYGLIPQTLIDILLATGLLFSYPDLLTKAQALALAQSHLDRGLLCITHSMESLSIYDMLGLHLAIFVVTSICVDSRFYTEKTALYPAAPTDRLPDTCHPKWNIR
ncbi:hypothetical protein EDD86DRAFT_84315 [Gorgonomyces haynaldii]|nr:hypothetical protein EDD86DRAFT_84315 [Gorgonomyces haynaldii]